MPRAQEVARAIKLTETHGVDNCHNLDGRSKERGCYQYVESTWRLYSKEVLGYVAPRTEVNEEYVAVLKVHKWLLQGYTEKEVALMWNGGNTTVKQGVNKYGVPYDTGAYARKVLTHLSN